MVYKSTTTIPSGNSKPRPTRTSDSVVWRTSKGKATTAGDLVSSVRFSWDANQTHLFRKFLMTVGLGFKNADLTPLLVGLNLDGYEKISNCYGENVHSLIMEKVSRKLRNTADAMDLKTLLETSHGRNETKLGPKENDNGEHDDETVKSEPLETPSSGLHLAYERASPPRNIPVKLPKQTATDTSPLSQSTLKHEPEVPSPFVFTSPSDLVSRTGAKVKSEQPQPSFNFRGPQDPKVPPVPAPSKAPSNTKASELLLAAKRLGPAIAAMENAVKDVKFALDEVPEGEARKNIATIVRHMEFAFLDVQVDAEDLEELAEAQAKG
ncbi:hypothetical protein Hte_010658 [Hypoxylon texense]